MGRLNVWRGVGAAALTVGVWGCHGAIGGPGAGSSPGQDGDPVVGDALALWGERCAGCHGDFGPGSTLSSGDLNGDFRLDAVAALERHGDGLETYIDETMPLGEPDRCIGACADVLGSYLRSIRPPAEIVCTGDEPPPIGRRELKLLTSSEYQRALEDLLGVPTDFGSRVDHHDGRRGGFVDMSGKTVSSTLLDTYTRNAEAVATWAEANDQPFPCDGSARCADRFVDEFLFAAFRGPVSPEQADAYHELITDHPGDGFALALEAALTSPYFLYRIEAGVDVEDARAAGYYDPTRADPGVGGTMPSDTAVEVVLARAFQPGSDGRLDGDAWALFENGVIRLSFAAPLTDPAVIEVEARGSNHDAIWPELTVRVDGREVGTRTIDSASSRAYRFEVVGVGGTPTVELAFENDSGVPPYGPGQDANLFVVAARLFLTEDPPAPDPDPPPADAGDSVLDGAEPDVWVLTPYELAATLAFRLTGTTPDASLLDAARRGRLATRDQIRAQVVRLIDSPRGRQRMSDFVTSWFRLEDLPDVSRPDVPELTGAVKAAMLEEVQTHFLHVFYDDAAPWSEFFGGDYTFLDRTLAEYYGIEGSFGDGFQRTEVEHRGGPLASGAFMTLNAHVDRTAPILRAVRARETALCHYIDPPNSPIAGDDIDVQRAMAQDRVTEREMEAGVLSSREFYFLYTDGISACAGCHEKIINPMFGMEDFDNVGRLRPVAGPNEVFETVHGMETPVSIEGTLIGVASTSDPDVIEYAGAKDFSNQIADTDAIDLCLARRGFRFLTGATYVDRDLDASFQETLTPEQRAGLQCAAARMLEAFAEHGDSPRAMFIELATDSILLFRR